MLAESSYGWPDGAMDRVSRRVNLIERSEIQSESEAVTDARPRMRWEHHLLVAPCLAGPLVSRDMSRTEQF